MKQRSPILMFWYRYRIEIMMWATVGDMLISSMTGTHWPAEPRQGMIPTRLHAILAGGIKYAWMEAVIGKSSC